MRLIVDTREKEKSGELQFVETEGVEVVRECLPVGDYTAESGGVRDKAVVERKAIGDLFGSFSSGYEAERAKIIRAGELGLEFHIAVEASIFDVRSGYEYWRDGELRRSKADGISMVKRLMTIVRKYGVQVHFFNGRREMAFWIMEFFLAANRVKKDGAGDFEIKR